MKKITYFYALLFAMLIGGGWTNFAWAATYYWNIKVVPVYIDANGNTTNSGDAQFALDGTNTTSTSTDWKNGLSAYTFDSYTATKSTKPYLHVTVPSGYYFWGFYDISKTSASTTYGGYDSSKSEKYLEYYGTGTKYDLVNYQVSQAGVSGSKPTLTTYHAVFRTYPYYRYSHKLTMYGDGNSALLAKMKNTSTSVMDFITNDDSYTTEHPNTLTSASKNFTVRAKSNQSPFIFPDTIRVLAKHGYLIDLTATQNSLPANVTIVDLTNVRKGLYRLDVTGTGTAGTSVNVNPNCTIKTKAIEKATTITVQKAAAGGTISGSFSYYAFTSTTLKFEEHGDPISLGEKDTEWSDNKIPCGDDPIYEGDVLTLTASPLEGCIFNGWYKVNNDKSLALVTRDLTFQTSISSDDVTYYADFEKVKCILISELENYPTIRLNFNSLEKAIAYANNNDKDGRTKTILLNENYTLPAGNYTIPTQTTLVIPYSAEQTSAKPHIDRTLGDAVPSEAYRTLTLADGVHIDVFGAIEVGGQQTGGTATSTSLARPGGDTYGLMQMNSGSSITLYENANFYAWGFVTGEGTMDMRRGAVVREQFQINDWKTLGPTCQMAAGSSINYQLHVLPINQYFIQNIEVKTTYRPGSRLLGQVCAYVVGYNLAFNDVGIIGVKYSAAEKAADPTLEDDVAIFLMDNEDDSEDTWVRKSYDVAHDTQLYEVNNSAYLGSLKMYVDLKGTPVNLSTYGYGTQDHLNVDSKDFVLPLTNNFKIHLLYGNLYATQNTVLLPGAEIEVNKKSTLTINANQTLSLYDANQWGQYTVVGVTDGDLDFGYATRIKCRPGGVPTVRDISSAAGLGDAMLNVHGSVDVKGYLKTTTGDKKASNIKSEGTYTFSYEDVTTPLDGGAAVVSTIADAGTITFSKTAPSVSDGTNKGHYLWQVTGPMSTTNDVRYVGDHEIPALLTNEDDSFAHTASTAAGTSFCFIDFNGDGKGEWKSLTTDGCFVKDEKEVYYAKPQDYVALANGKTSNNNHTYSAVDGRTLILVDDCQWWEVEPVENRPDLFHCTHPLNDMYYYWDGTKWTEKRYTVTWNDWDGEEYDTYSLKYGVQPKYLGNIPARDKDDYYTYDFIGWSPEITESTIVTGDITYTAQYARTDRMYTVTWTDEGGNVIETGYFKMGEVPTCESAPDMANKEWNPAVSAVTGNTTYTLQAKAVKANYTITWKNWDGTTLQTTTPAANTSADDVLAGYTEDDPTKPALGDIEFTFKAWSPTVAAATADAVYTATFTEKPITYTITWKNDDGTTLGTSEVTPNTVPQYNGTPVRSSDGENYFFAGWTPALAAATADAAYTATYTSKNRIVEDETYEVPEGTNVSIVNLIIRNDGTMEIPSSSSFNANTLTLESNGTTSGQIIGAARLYLTGDAIFRLEKSMAAATWYAVAVPWTVDIKKGVYAGGKRLSAGEFFVIEFDATVYASADRETGTYWNFLDETGKDMKPGKLYMIWFKSAQSAVEFHKTSGTLLTTSTSVVLASGTNTDQSNWNAIANPALYYADLGVSVDDTEHDVLKYNGNDSYVVDNTTNMIVGEPMFVQVNSSATIIATQSGGVSGMPAYRRTSQDVTEKDNRFVVEIIRDGQMNDRIIVQTAEEKADEYVIGKDLAKIGVGTKAAQMWMERYNTQLCKNTLEMKGEQVDYPLSLYAPAAGEYILTAAQERGEATLYLTRNDKPVWNLSYGEYVLNLEKGTTTEYGLRLIAKAPQITTGIGNVQGGDAQCTKVLRDGVIYILRGNNVYTIDGQLVK